MSKQELARRIVRDMGYDYQTVRNIIDGIAFEGWLHDPGQVPGRTITESEFDEIAGTSSPSRREDFRRFLKRKNFTVVPDPEPTNAEKLMSDIEGIKRRVVQPTSEELADELADLGWTKAPEAGGDS